MASKKILSKHQKHFLDFAAKQNYIFENFYLTGGTALAAFYLRHRLSEDLDFFNEKEEVNLEVLIGSKFLLASEVKDLPIMIKKISHQAWRNFFRKEAKKLAQEIFE